MMSMSGLSTPWCSPSKAISLLWWITNPNQVWLGRVMEVYEPQEAPQTLRYVVFALVLAESVLFLGLFLGLQFVAALQLKSPIKCGLSPVLVCFHARFFRMPPERKAFAEKTLWIILFLSILSFTGVWKNHHFDYETWPTDCYDIWWVWVQDCQTYKGSMFDSIWSLQMFEQMGNVHRFRGSPNFIQTRRFLPRQFFHVLYAYMRQQGRQNRSWALLIPRRYLRRMILYIYIIDTVGWAFLQPNKINYIIYIYVGSGPHTPSGLFAPHGPKVPATCSTLRPGSDLTLPKLWKTLFASLCKLSGHRCARNLGTFIGVHAGSFHIQN